MRSNNNFVYIPFSSSHKSNMYPGRILLLPFDSCYSLYGYCLAVTVLLVMQEYIYT